MYSTSNIAILMATYKGEKYIKEQIESIINQSYQNWELFIHDDGSDDSTLDIVADYTKKYSNKIHLIAGPPTGGAKKNFLYLLSCIEAPYIMFCDQDDIWNQNKIEMMFSRMKQAEFDAMKKMPCLVFSDATVVDQDLNIVASRFSKYQKLSPSKAKFNNLIINNVCVGCTMMLNKSLKDIITVTQDYKSIIMHDWWCALIASYFGIIEYIDEPLVLYRQHKNNTVGAKHYYKFSTIYSAIKKNKNVKEDMKIIKRQVSFFSEIYNINNNVVKGFLDGNEKMLQRLLFHAKNNVWKSGFWRNIRMIIWGG